jgi:pimeloyl-ACP methyl ester carboxylesterase
MSTSPETKPAPAKPAPAKPAPTKPAPWAFAAPWGARGYVSDLDGTPVILVGNSMGGLISILQASAEPDIVAGLVLIDPACHRRGTCPTGRWGAGS